MMSIISFPLDFILMLFVRISIGLLVDVMNVGLLTGKSHEALSDVLGHQFIGGKVKNSTNVFIGLDTAKDHLRGQFHYSV